MQKRKLGSQGLEVSALGLGCMGMSWAYGPSDDSESLNVLDRALELGINFWDTAEIYGPFINEELLGRSLKGKSRDKIVIATKFAWHFNEKGEQDRLDGSPANIRRAIEGSLKRLGTDYIDLYYQHRLDPKTPIEETVGELGRLVKEGKVRFIGLSEVGPATIRRAHKIHPLSAVQTEYSLWERHVEEKIIPTLRELGVGLVAYSPIGRGFLSGKIKSPQDLDSTDWRRSNPRFLEENFQRNMKLVDEVRQIAEKNDATPAQVALAWLLRQGNDVVPIPGTKHVKYLEENAGAAELEISDFDWEELGREISGFEAAGLRYPEGAMKAIDKSE